MITSNILKSKKITAFGLVGVCDLPAILGGALLSLSLVLLVPAAHAQPALSGALDNVAERAIEDSVQDRVDDGLQEAIAEEVEQGVTDDLDVTLEGEIEDEIEQDVEDAIEGIVEESVQDSVEDNIVDSVSEDVEQSLEDAVEEELAVSAEESVEASVEESVEAGVEESVEASTEELVEASVEESVEASTEELVEASVEESVEASAEELVEASVEESVEASAEELVEVSIEESVEASAESEVESAVEIQVSAAIEDRIEEGIDDILERIEMDEDRIHKDHWLVMAAPEVFEELADEGYLFETVTELPGLGLRLAEVAAPSSFDITSVRQGVIDIVGSDRAEVDLNHIYTAGEELAEQSGDGMMPRNAIEFPPDTELMSLRIGMIDSQVDVSHPALQHARIESRAFTSSGAKIPEFHGTAIASIIAGNSADYVGIAPNAEVYAAGVFEQDSERGDIASTVSLVRALDWLISSGVDVINISLAGPPNRLLESALEKASQSNVIILAAAGNGGPVAEPMYPAAYASVVAVTAVDSKGQIFRLANRGDYLDIAAPGVALRHAKSGGGYASSSGTSFAVPFAATAVARLRLLQPGENALELLCRTAEDLGPPGRDSIYGFGLLRPASS
tara:strand:+ start:78286 stop:80154 length:1869 start_codon:yes stop_codon:yes gene_type:complete